MIEEFYIKSRNNLNVKVISDGVIVKFITSPETNTEEHILKDIVGNPTYGYSLQSLKGNVLPLNNEDLSKFDNLRPIIKKFADEQKKKSNTIGCFSIIAVIALLIIIGGITDNDTTAPANQDAKNTSVASAAQKKEAVPDLGYNVDEFKRRYNLASGELHQDFRINDIETSEGLTSDTIAIDIEGRSHINGTISKENGNLLSLTLITVPTGDQLNSVKIILDLGILIMTSNPNLTPNERGDIFRKLGLIGENVDLTSHNESIIEGDVKYTISTSTMTGIFFTIEPSTAP